MSQGEAQRCMGGRLEGEGAKAVRLPSWLLSSQFGSRQGAR